VLIRLKWGIEYKGILVSYDKYMNFQLKNSEEIIDNQTTGYLGDILVRCNNVLFVKECFE
jgi:small nuclear ribonucleoprotein F